MNYSLASIADEQISEIMENLFAEGGAEYAYSLPIPSLSVPGVCNFYAVHLAIWQIREDDLQKMFPLNTPLQRLNFLAWCVVHGQHEYRALRDLTAFWNELSLPATIEITEWSGGISRLLQLAIIGRPDLMIDPALSTDHDQESALAWLYLKGGLEELNQAGPAIALWQRKFLLGHGNLMSSNFVKLLYRSRQDLRDAFDLSTDNGTRDFSTWLISHAAVETSLTKIISPAKRAWPNPTNTPDKNRFGVNLIGYAYGELGIGEDVRMAAFALDAAKIPFTIINVAPGSTIRQNDRSVEKWVSTEPCYMINIVCLTALEHLRVYLEKGQSLFNGRYNIGYWPWELQNWPKKWIHCFNLIDEMWASSKHIERSVKAAGEIPVLNMPMAVHSRFDNIDKNKTRKQYGLPLDKKLFVFSFDGNSYTKRKNPSGIVEAFLRAFPAGEEEACLVIKCMRPDKGSLEWIQILETARRDQRLIILDTTLTKDEVMKLYQSCDCFVSLHRAEGFGRGIAEAITLQLEVIATGYGGNVEFCKAANALLIPFDLVVLNADDYVEAEGNFWAEPDLEFAAEAMRAIYNNKRDIGVEETAIRRQQTARIFSPEFIGIRYAERLKKITSALESQP